MVFKKAYGRHMLSLNMPASVPEKLRTRMTNRLVWWRTKSSLAGGSNDFVQKAHAGLSRPHKEEYSQSAIESRLLYNKLVYLGKPTVVIRLEPRKWSTLVVRHIKHDTS